jgi:hypothetical protein
MEGQERDRRLDTLLDDLGAEEPPAGFAERTMAVIRGSGNGARLMLWTGGIEMRKRLMWGLAAAAAIVLAYFAVNGFPKVDQGSEATIGAAKRYQAGQIDSKDVVLGDQSVQQFMQSDVFDRLVKDPAAVRALSDAGIRAQIADADILRAIGDPQLVAWLKTYATGAQSIFAMSCDSCQAALESVEVRAALKNEVFARYVQDAEFIAALQNANIAAALARHDLEAALANVRLQAALKAPDISAALQNKEFLAAIRNAQFVSAIRDQGLYRAIQAPGLMLAVSNAKLAAAIQSDAFQTAVRASEFKAALQAQSFASAMQVSAAQIRY